jgi:hypothetical protein
MKKFIVRLIDNEFMLDFAISADKYEESNAFIHFFIGNEIVASIRSDLLASIVNEKTKVKNIRNI